MSGNGQARRASRLRGWTLAMIYLLIVQFFAGMITNLYVTIPAHHPGSNAHNYFTGATDSMGWALSSGGIWLAVHAALGLALGLLALHLIMQAVLSHQRRWIWASVAGAVFLIGAGFNGASFLVFGMNYSSLLMAGLFGLSLASYLTGLYLDARPGALRMASSGGRRA